MKRTDGTVKKKGEEVLRRGTENQWRNLWSNILTIQLKPHKNKFLVKIKILMTLWYNCVSMSNNNTCIYAINMILNSHSNKRFIFCQWETSFSNHWGLWMISGNIYIWIGLKLHKIIFVVIKDLTKEGTLLLKILD